MTTQTNAGRRNIGTSRGGFSLLELLVVLGILVIVMAIVIPALSGARNAARKNATQSVMTAIATSVGQFNLSERRLPGYFSARDMGVTNTVFTGMENIMLDLAGGIRTDDPAVTQGIVEVGPRNNNTVKVEVGRIGASGQDAKGVIAKGYYKPDPKFFQVQTGNQRAGGEEQMPVIVDAWGTPILAWEQDSGAPASAPFASRDSATRAKFYRASNRVFLEATSLGRLGINQRSDEGTILEDSNSGVTTMGSLLGNPAFPDPDDATKPAAARAPIVLHSAGTNGVYLGKLERGGKRAAGAGLPYQAGQDPIEGGSFDDFIVRGE